MNHNSDAYKSLMPLAESGSTEAVFGNRELRGVRSWSPIWVFNFSKAKALENTNRTISAYNTRREQYQEVLADCAAEDPDTVKEAFMASVREVDGKRVQWSPRLWGDLWENVKMAPVAESQMRQVMWRPFCKKWMAYDAPILEQPVEWKDVFPSPDAANLVIACAHAPLTAPFATLMTNVIQQRHVLGEGMVGLPQDIHLDGQDRTAISQSALGAFQQRYGADVTDDDIFFYTYGVLHSPEYRRRYAQDLAEQHTVRIPFLKDLDGYARIGRELADLHLRYEEPADLSQVPGLSVEVHGGGYRVERMRFATEEGEERKDTILYSDGITVRGIPLRAYEYVIGSRSAIEWVMHAYRVKVDETNDIRDDPNDFSEHPTYILNVLVSVISLSLRTLDLVDELPEYEELG